MNETKSLTEEIMEEAEYQIPVRAPDKVAFTSPEKSKIERSIDIIDTALRPNRRPCLAFSGGSDSLVLLDLMSKAGYKPFIIWADTQMEYPETRPFIEKIAAQYGLELSVARSNRTPLEQWKATGWPMLGKMSARLWMKKNRGKMGFEINVSECCRGVKIIPARILTKNLGCNIQITGQRGKEDDNLRALRTLKDGVLYYQARDKIWIANPLSGWTDAEIKGYTRDHNLPGHPARQRGALTIGCIYCGGGSQFTNSGYRILRKIWKEAWADFMVKWEGGLIVLALKYKAHLFHIKVAVEELGGLGYLAENQPWIFDFTRKKPLLGYNK